MQTPSPLLNIFNASAPRLTPCQIIAIYSNRAQKRHARQSLLERLPIAYPVEVCHRLALPCSSLNVVVNHPKILSASAMRVELCGVCVPALCPRSVANGGGVPRKRAGKLSIYANIIYYANRLVNSKKH
jgi:hypothetical protein